MSTALALTVVVGQTIHTGVQIPKAQILTMLATYITLTVVKQHRFFSKIKVWTNYWLVNCVSLLDMSPPLSRQQLFLAWPEVCQIRTRAVLVSAAGWVGTPQTLRPVAGMPAVRLDMKLLVL